MGSVGKDKYVTFSSTARHDLGFNSDDGETDRWFSEHTNSDQLFDDIFENLGENTQAYLAFYHWLHGDFEHGEQYMNFSDMPKQHQNDTKLFDEYIDRSVLDKGIVVHRTSTPELLFGAGKKLVTEEDLQKIIGKEIVSKSNLSTSAASEGLRIRGDVLGGKHYRQIDYEIKVPSGKGNGIYLNNTKHDFQASDDQREFMLRRDIVLKPVSYKKISDGEHGKPQYRVVLEWVKKNSYRHE